MADNSQVPNPPQPTQPMSSEAGSVPHQSGDESGGSLTSFLSESQLSGFAPLTGSLRAIDLTDKVLGEFKLLRRLGTGGMAEVWLAEQLSLKRQVAIKVMRPAMSGDVHGRKRFENEALAAAALHHPNIVQVFAVGEADGIQFIAQEYVEGMNMRDYISKKGPPTVAIGLQLMKQITAALEAANEAGIVHRDIKPENILLTRKGHAKVADFGLAQLRQGDDAVRMTQTGMTLGTPLYMSPEQVQGKKLDHRSDLYSLGVTFYHLLTGRPPFRGESTFAIAYNHVHTAPPQVIDIRRDVPPRLSQIVQRMMSKKPDERFPSARDLLRELREFEKAFVVSCQNADDVQLSATVPFVKRPELSPAKPGWLSSDKRARAMFAIAALLVGTVSAWAGARSQNGSAFRQPIEQRAHVAQQPTVKRQLELARDQETEAAWRGVLAWFPGFGPEQQQARQVLIPRLIQEHRLREAERLCLDVIRAKQSSPEALSMAWAGRALIQGLQDNWGLAHKTWNEHVGSQAAELPPEMLDWWQEIEQSHNRPPRSGSTPPRGPNPPRNAVNPPRSANRRP